VYEYFDLRNRLLWAERNLTLRRRTKMWANTLGLLCPLLPRIGGVLWQLLRFRVGTRQAYWESRKLAEEWWAERGQPHTRMVQQVRWRAVYDYLVRRFGNCPASVRTAAGRARPAEAT
jgi:hypothetical protein